MADVNVSVMVDGKAVFVHGAVGAPDGQACVVGGLQVALRHFQDILASRAPAPVAQTLGQSESAAQKLYGSQSQTAAKPQDTSL